MIHFGQNKKGTVDYVQNVWMQREETGKTHQRHLQQVRQKNRRVYL